MDDSATGYGLPSTVQVLVNGSSLGSFSNDNNTPNHLNWEQFTVHFTGTGGDTVQFQNATPAGDNELGLDNVSLNVSAAPEPASMLLFGAGMLAVFAICRKQPRRF